MKFAIVLFTVVMYIVLNFTEGQVQYVTTTGNPWEHAPPNIQMLEYLYKSAEKYDIPYVYARRVAYLETGFKGLYDFNYNPSQTSQSNAEGPMQILLSTAEFIAKKPVDRSRLRNNIEFNVDLSTKYARHLYDRYKSWLLVFSFYSQGAVGLDSINGYARFVVSR